MASKDNPGRAGIDVEHAPHSRATRANRRRIIQESMRALDETLVEREARRNAEVDSNRSHLNRTYVNDARGGLKRADSLDEVLDYGDEREARVKRKIRDNSRTITTVVSFLPKSLCTEPKKWRNAKGEVRTYYEPRSEEEMMRYFAMVVDHVGSILPGGLDAIHGFDVNLDETTPHIQILADNFGPDPKNDGYLSVQYSQTWGSHRDVRDERGRQKSGRRKMVDYQADLRAKAIAAGFPVEFDPSPESQRKLTKLQYQREQALLDWEERLRDQQERLDDECAATQAALARARALVAALDKAPPAWEAYLARQPKVAANFNQFKDRYRQANERLAQSATQHEPSPSTTSPDHDGLSPAG